MKLYDVIALKHDVPAHGLVGGQVGTAVMDLGDGNFEVEFADLQGVTYATLALQQDDVIVLRHEPVQLAA